MQTDAPRIMHLMQWQGTEEESCFSPQGFLRWLLSLSEVVSFHGLSRKLDGGMKDQLAPGGDGEEELSSAGGDCPPAPQAQICPPGWCGGLTSLLPKPAALFSPFLGSLPTPQPFHWAASCLQPHSPGHLLPVSVHQEPAPGRALSPFSLPWLPLLSSALNPRFQASLQSFKANLLLASYFFGETQALEQRIREEHWVCHALCPVVPNLANSANTTSSRSWLPLPPAGAGDVTEGLGHHP